MSKAKELRDVIRKARFDNLSYSTKSKNVAQQFASGSKITPVSDISLIGRLNDNYALNTLTGSQPAKKLKRAHSRAVAPINLNLIKENLLGDHRSDKNSTNLDSKWMSKGS